MSPRPSGLPVSASGRQGLCRALIGSCGVWMVGLGAYFVLVRPALLPEDVRYIGLSLDDIERQLPGLKAWLGHVFTVMGGFMAGAGVLTLHLARRSVWGGPGATWALAIAGALTVLLMSAINFSIHSDFRWLLLVPAILWALALALMLTGDASDRT